MKDRALVLLSLIISVGALCYAAWVHQHAEQMAQQALRNRERQFVQAFAPRIQSAYEGLGITNAVGNAQTLEELFGPYLDVFNRMTVPPDGDKKTP